MKQSFFFHLPNDVDSLMQLAARIRELEPYRELAGECCYVLDLALEEMATNIIKYGYDQPGARTIEIGIDFGVEVITLTLTDDGHEFNPLTAPAPDGGELAERDVGGVGIYLVAQLARAMTYRREHERNILTIEIGRKQGLAADRS